MDNHTKVLVSELPNCDFCSMDNKKVKAKYDGRTTYLWTRGSWANMCEKHFNLLGVGLGLGKGQKLIVRR